MKGSYFICLYYQDIGSKWRGIQRCSGNRIAASELGVRVDMLLEKTIEIETENSEESNYGYIVIKEVLYSTGMLVFA